MRSIGLKVILALSNKRKGETADWCIPGASGGVAVPVPVGGNYVITDDLES